MKLEVGMYVKCKNGNIAKVKKIDEQYPKFLTKYFFDNVIGTTYVSQYYYPKEILECYWTDLDNYILKSNHSIINLIEVGDYVNGYKVVDFSETYFNGVDRREKPKRIGLKVINGKFDYENYIEADEIKDIVTKEQFNSVKYEVE